MEWKGANALVLNEYFENKEKLFELKKKEIENRVRCES